MKNTEKRPQVVIQVGQRAFQAQAIHLPPQEAEAILVAYARKHPHLIRWLFRLLLGYRLGNREEDVRALASQSILMAFEALSPRTSGYA